MNKREYYLKCMSTNVYRKLDWVVSVFSVVKDRPHLSDATYDYQIIYDPLDKDKLFFAKKENDRFVSYPIDGSKSDHPLFGAKEGVDIVDGDIPLTTGDINTTYGIILGNMYLLHYPFGNKFKYINTVIGGDFDSSISKLLSDYPPPGTERDPTKIYVDEYKRYGEACGSIAAMDKLFSTGGSQATLSIHPDVIKLRNHLLEKHKHELHDIRVQAMIEDLLVKADKESFKDDPDALDFLISGKSFNPTRKKQLIMIGGSGGFGGVKGSFIGTSLLEGWDLEDIPIYANEARSGSYNRGIETAMGGVDVKTGTRMMMNAKLNTEFCNTKKAKTAYIDENNHNQFIGLYYLENNKPMQLDAANIKSFIGKVLPILSPQYCAAEGDSYCAYCVGKNWTLLERGLSSAVTNTGDVFMYDKMGRMHGKPLVPATFRFLHHIR